MIRPIERMTRDVEREIARGYKANTPELAVYAQDESPARALSRIVDKLSRKWAAEFDELSPRLAAYFATAAKDRVDRTLKADMRKAGLTVKFKATKAMNDAYQAVFLENVGLIKSIPDRYMDQVKTLTMQSVSRGGDLGSLAKGLQDQAGVTKRRAALIARDQCAKATAVMTRTRYLGLGITEAIWLHSAGGKVPRPPHVSFSGKRYSLAKGHDFDDGLGPVHPGEAINCRCVMKAVIL